MKAVFTLMSIYREDDTRHGCYIRWFGVKFTNKPVYTNIDVCIYNEVASIHIDEYLCENIDQYTIKMTDNPWNRIISSFSVSDHVRYDMCVMETYRCESVQGMLEFDDDYNTDLRFHDINDNQTILAPVEITFEFIVLLNETFFNTSERWSCGLYDKKDQIDLDDWYNWTDHYKTYVILLL